MASCLVASAISFVLLENECKAVVPHMLFTVYGGV